MTTHEDSQEFAARLHAVAIRPFVDEIVPIVFRDEIACVVFEPDDLVAAAATALGWDGSCAVFAMSQSCRDLLVQFLGPDDPDDEAVRSYLTGSQPGRVMVFIDDGTYLVKYDPLDTAVDLNT